VAFSILFGTPCRFGESAISVAGSVIAALVLHCLLQCSPCGAPHRGALLSFGPPLGLQNNPDQNATFGWEYQLIYGYFYRLIHAIVRSYR
jgi:hypothetical protein